jgi:DNA-binding transcriptional LysR family regulator
MNIRQLEAFRAVVLVGTMVGAADLMGISQPSISRLIAQLEQALSVVLFDRAVGRLVLTPEGKMIYDVVERAFGALDRISEFAAEIQNVQAGSLSIACMPALGTGFLPGVIGDFYKEHPKVSISLNIETSPKIEDWIVHQHMDIGLAQLPFSREDIVMEEFCSLPYYAVVPKDHPYAGKTTLTPGDFEGESFISLTKSNSVRHLIDQMFSEHGVNRIQKVEVSQLSVVADLVGSGVGLSLLDPFSVAAGLNKPIKAVFLKPSVDFRIGLMYPSQRPLSKVGRNFIQFMKKKRDQQLAAVRASIGRNGKSGH